MSGRSSQRKGRKGECELAAVLQSYGYDVQPAQALNYGTIPDLVGLPRVHIECKRVEKLNVPEAMNQAIADSRKFGDGTPVLFHRRSRSPWLCTMLLSDWVEMYKGKGPEG